MEVKFILMILTCLYFKTEALEFHNTAMVALRVPEVVVKEALLDIL